MSEQNKCSGACGDCASKDSCQEPKKNTVERDEFASLDYAIKLSYAIVDRSELDKEEKRNLLFSLYSFRCLFDTTPLYSLSSILVKYGCSFFTADEKIKNQPHVYAIKDSKGQIAYKFDAGSPVWMKAVRERKITGLNATVPQKLTLFEMAYKVCSLSTATAELKGLWLVFFPYVFLIGAPVEYDIYDKLKEIVHTVEVFSSTNEMREKR